MTPKQILSSKIIASLFIVLLAFLVNSKIGQWRQQRAIDKLKNDLLKQADAQQKKNQELSDSISFLNSSDFKEQVARQQLNLKKQGEAVYNFTQGDNSTTTAMADSLSTGSNPQKWWKYFFQ